MTDRERCAICQRWGAYNLRRADEDPTTAQWSTRMADYWYELAGEHTTEEHSAPPK